MIPITLADISDADMVHLCYAVGVGGMFVIALVMFFGSQLVDREEDVFWRQFWRALTDYWSKTKVKPALSPLLIDASAERLQRRNEFWVAYIQVVVAIASITAVAILL